MQLREYKESRAETWLNSARGLIIEDAEHSADGSHSSWTHFATVLRVKYRCFIALFVALFELGSSSVRLLWNRTFGRWNTQNKQRLRRAKDGFYQSLDGVFDSLSGLFNVQSILTAADRGNVKRIGELSVRLREMTRVGDLQLETRRELDHWYQTAKVYVKQGGHVARSEVKGLSEVLDRLLTAPDAQPDKLRSWRWERDQNLRVGLEKIKGVRWRPSKAAPIDAEITPLKARRWTVKATSTAEAERDAG